MPSTKQLVRVLVLVLALGAGACSQRYIIDVVDHADGQTSLVQTYDIRNYLIVKTKKDVFWDCHTNDEGKLICVRACDRKDEQGAKILCPKTTEFGW